MSAPPIITADRLVRTSPSMRASCGLLKDYWYVAAQSHQLSAARPIGRTILGEKLALFRTREGRAVAMLDRCLHRNSPLSAGVVIDGCVACPYHGWMYDGDGRCVNIPSEGPDGATPHGLAVESFPVREQQGLVWVWMGGSSPPDKEPFSMPYDDAPEWAHYVMETRFENAVTPLVENFMDVPHTVFVHSGWFRSRARLRVGMKVERTEDSVLVTYDQPKDAISVSQLLVNPKGLPLTHTDNFYMPSVTRVDYVWGDLETGFVITSQCTPIGPHETQVYTHIAYKSFYNPLFFRLARFYTQRVIQQDVEIMKVHGENLKHYAERQYTSTPADLHHVYIESLRDWAEAGGVDPKPNPVVERSGFWI